MSQPRPFWGEASPQPAADTLLDSLRNLIELALTDGTFEVQRAEAAETGVLRFNLALTVRHGRPVGSSSSLVFEKKLGL
jgi:hypothetical protein